MASFTAPVRSRSLFKPSPLSLAPRTRYTDAIWKRFLASRVCFSNTRLPAVPKLSMSSSSQSANQEPVTLSVQPKQLGAAPNRFLGQGLPSLKPKLARRTRSLEPTRAYQNDFFKIKLPKIIEKPEWWWRTLACIPYLIALQISDVGFYVQPFLEHYESMGDMIFFIPGAIRRWPTWFFMAYCYIAYLWLVKNKDLPHFFRFHVMMGMLLETALQIIWCASNFFPLIHFNGRLGMYYWAAIGFAYICVLLECVRCALGGMYVQIPFISDAAFIHTLFQLGGFQRPFR